ncbi:DUF5829 family protein [Mucilaginibacter psychrotolerans]|uniref:Uncharacterized protein n=1 Tax=Mucilaginibacter psychrotolerans TaxID=1524096 RepID=A0A4Y8S8H9_9SPHI|nr:DUF5829 family protein [Mucilaginibacter psychrotolerans]TFF35202.1 hypothetical protein E2R66_19755 [Mucilaginibacter psychrotolerans]
MRKFLFILAAILLPILSQAQTAKPQIDLNTVFVCIDSVTYQKLFENKYLKDTLFFCRAQATTTGTGQYAGKYFMGLAATMEFFKPKASQTLGDKYADLGIEFKTRSTTGLDWYAKYAAKKKLATAIETITLDDEGKKINWYKQLNIKNDQITSRFVVSILEYQKEILSMMGFSPKEIASPMTYRQYNEKLSGGRKYPRQFNTFNEVSITINSAELAYLKKAMKMIQFSQKGNSFYSDGVVINYKVDEQATFRLNAVGISLLNKMPDRDIAISEKLNVVVRGDKARLVFND